MIDVDIPTTVLAIVPGFAILITLLSIVILSGANPEIKNISTYVTTIVINYCKAEGMKSENIRMINVLSPNNLWINLFLLVLFSFRYLKLSSKVFILIFDSI